MADAPATPVRWDTYVRAQSDTTFKSYADAAFGKFDHIRQPTPIDQQNVIRMNRDTLYSIGIFDLTEPVTITKPDTGDRYQSMMVLSQDEYIPMVAYDPGDYTLTEDLVGTRYVLALLRTLVDATKPEDITAVNAIQDQVAISQASPGTFEIPNWDQQELRKLTAAINVLADTLTDTSKCFGTKEEVDPIPHLLGAAFGWGGLPAKDATYKTVTPEQNDGKTPHVLSVKDVPVDGFWSISLYNKAGYFDKSPSGVYVINDRNATRDRTGASPFTSAAIRSSPTTSTSWTAGTTSFASTVRARRSSTGRGPSRRPNPPENGRPSGSTAKIASRRRPPWARASRRRLRP